MGGHTWVFMQYLMGLRRLGFDVLFLDRLTIIAKRATLEPLVRPALLFIDLDKFKSVSASFGLIVGDSLLLTIARRLGRHRRGEHASAQATARLG